MCLASGLGALHVASNEYIIRQLWKKVINFARIAGEIYTQWTKDRESFQGTLVKLALVHC